MSLSPDRSLVVISGLPGVGKTAVAASVAARTISVHLSVDPVEDAMLDCGLPSGWNTGVAAYEAVRTLAEQNISLGHPVVVDAVNDSEAARDTWRNAASQQGATLKLVHLTCGDPVEHRRRLEGRQRGFTRLPEPTWHQVLDRKRDYPAWNDPHLEIDTGMASVEEITDRVCTWIRARK